MKKIFALIIASGIFLVGCNEVTTTAQDSSAPTNITEEMPTAPTQEDQDTDMVTTDSDLGAMATYDLYGEPVTVDVFSDYDITLVNVWATWCPPCVEEMPHLAEIAKEMGADGVGVVGIMSDAVSGGAIDEEALMTGHSIMQGAGTEYPNIIVDEILYNELLSQSQVLPTTFFVDSNGNIVGNKYEGSRNKEEWQEVINTELANL